MLVGLLCHPRDTTKKIQPILQRHDILFIVDEVISGFYRIGDMFASQTYGLKPDLITLAKALSAGYQPIGGVMVNEKIHEVLVEGSRQFGIFGTGFTYSGHPVPAAVALETQKIYEDINIGDHVKAVSGYFLQQLNSLADHPLVGEVRGIGLIGAVELVKNKGARINFDPAQKVGPWVMNRALEHRLIVRALVNDTIAFCPPLIIEKTQIEDMFDCFERTLDDAVGYVAEL